ncbi:MAG: homoserine kinase [Chloroflexi bacterium]|nr:homoserine kinase [Chloroflexota bacterium]
MASHVKVTIPASTANLGPGFDCLGLALGLFNTVEMWVWEGPATQPLSIEVVGEGAGQILEDERNLILRAVSRVFEKVGSPVPPVCVRATNGIPLGSGMGSSAAAAVGGLVAANALIDGRLSRKEIMRLAYEIEGHPDNAAPAIFGGLVIVSATGDELITQTVDVPPFQVAIALPNIRLSTAEARAVLPPLVPLEDAVFNIGRAALVVKAQPYRRRLFSVYDEVVVAARKAGAAAVALSGAGPSLVAFAADGHESIAKAMGEAIEKAGLDARTFVLPVDRQGVRVSVAG